MLTMLALSEDIQCHEWFHSSHKSPYYQTQGTQVQWAVTLVIADYLL